MEMTAMPKGHSFVRDGNARAFDAGKRKPHIMLFGDSDTDDDFRQLTALLRGSCHLSRYKSSEALPRAQILRAVDRTEILFFSPGKASCDPQSDVATLERLVLTRGCREENPVPLVMLVPHKREGFCSQLVLDFAPRTKLIVTELSNQSGGLLDVYTHTVRMCSMGAEILEHIEKLAIPRAPE